jgi:hypothetical protein
MGSRFLLASLAAATFCVAHFATRWATSPSQLAPGPAGMAQAYPGAAAPQDGSLRTPSRLARDLASAMDRQRAAGIVPTARISAIGKLAMEAPGDAAVITNAVNVHVFRMGHQAAAACFRDLVADEPFALECQLAVSGQDARSLVGRIDACALLEGSIADEHVRCMRDTLGKQIERIAIPKATREFRGAVPVRLNYGARARPAPEK